MTIQSERRSRGFRALPSERLRRYEGWGMVDAAMGYGYRAEHLDDVRAALEQARTTGRTLAARGRGYGYGDIALNAENIVLDLTPMNRILSWEPETGIARVEPGVTMGDLWRRTIGDGYWPAVVPGTMHPTLGGCFAVNAHGKNNWRAGTVLDSLVAAKLMLASGEVVELDSEHSAPLLNASVGGLGLLGVFVGFTIRLQRVTTGLLEVEQEAAPTLAGMFDLLDARRDAAYMVGWIDGFASGGALGRGLVQSARHAVGHPARALRPEEQDLPPHLFGVVPRSQLWRAMKLTVNDAGMRALNALRYATGRVRSGERTLVPLARFHFFHDYIPDWQRSFRPGGILQYQVFAPANSARSLFAALLRAAQEAGFPPYLAVIKAHRADDRTLLPYNPDGYSLSLDLRATVSNLPRLRATLARWTDELVLPAHARFYLAKDSVLTRSQAGRMLGDRRVEEFLALKRTLDPEEILQSNLYRRVFR